MSTQEKSDKILKDSARFQNSNPRTLHNMCKVYFETFVFMLITEFTNITSQAVQAHAGFLT